MRTLRGRRVRGQPEAEGRRGISPVLGVLTLLTLTVCLAGVLVVGVGAWSIASPRPTATFDLAANGSASTLDIEHVAGDPIDVDELSVTIAIDGRELDDQPPVPFVGASGFDGMPSGPFNAEAESEWTSGERAGLSLATTNQPELSPGDSVTVTLAVDDRQIATLETSAT
ncbi:type IV pilin [Natrinema saccharevitans]|uniref:Type IV pilin n=1 Tax=Natrinema saccharevitans TaxID=301967 RepID=A0A1S8AST0_9EURY|nr:type IV pilin [Natrinema saccharevitans]OLZ39597.1 type IV pilin [Natrinema saccharevitans]